MFDLLFTFLFSPKTAHAALLDPIWNTTPPTGLTDVEKLFSNATGLVYSVLGAAAVAMIVYAGILLTLANGDQNKIKKAREVLRYAVIGIIFIVLSQIAVVTFTVMFGGRVTP